MGAVNAASSVILEWTTGTKSDPKTHSVRLEIPPNELVFQYTKNVQKTVTTRGWAVQHGLPSLAVITASGQAYQPPQRERAIAEGFNPNAKINGLELLNSAYVASGRLSSNPDLFSTITTPTNLISTDPTKTLSPMEKFKNTISKRVETLNKIESVVRKIGVLDTENYVTFPAIEQNSMVTQNVDSLKNTLIPSILNAELDTDAQIITSVDLVNSLTLNNIDSVLTNLTQLSNTSIPKLVNVVSQFESMVAQYKNQNLGLSIPNVDSTVTTLLRRDPFSVIKSLSATTIADEVKKSVIDPIELAKKQQDISGDDWVIAIYLYWQDMVFVGHFDSFRHSQQASILGLWNWSFTFTAYDGWIVKDNNIFPYTRAFDSSLTLQESSDTTPESGRTTNPLQKIINSDNSITYVFGDA